MRSKYLNPIKYLGGAALIALVLALIFPSLTDGITEARIRNGVLIQALPFFAAFVCILLIYILIIWLIATRFNGKIPNRTYSAIELTLIVGILGGVVLLFQPASFVPYRYGFLVVLASLLGFILWSHVIGRGAKADLKLPKFATAHQIVGFVAFVVVAAVVSGLILNANAPREPYGVRERVWNSYDDARKAETAAAALAEFNAVETPFVIVMSLLPAALFFFAVREIVASLGGSRRSEPVITPTPSRTSA